MLKDVSVCSPRTEDCVANQTLKHESCLVPCAGLYADIADDIDSLKQTTDTLEQNVIRGETADIYQPTEPEISGFQTLVEELGAMAWSQYESKDRMIAALQQMFPALTDRKLKLDDVTRLTESYHNYKREYVKHLLFNPKEENSSKDILLVMFE